MNALQMKDFISTLANFSEEEHKLFMETCKSIHDAALRNTYVSLTVLTADLQKVRAARKRKNVAILPPPTEGKQDDH